MIDINFIEEGTDERILKSFIDNNNVDQEELEKLSETVLSWFQRPSQIRTN